jgi:hypothetical protein
MRRLLVMAAVAFPLDLRYRARQTTLLGESSMTKLVRVSLAALTFLFFFYSTTMLTSYFYPLDWAPLVF